MRERVSVRVIERVSERESEGVGERVCERVSVRVSVCVCGRAGDDHAGGGVRRHYRRLLFRTARGACLLLRCAAQALVR